MEIKKEYEKLKSKYSLPDYDELDKEFELLYVTQIQEVTFPLKFIRRRISDKIAVVCNMLQSLLNPNPGSMINLQESKFFENKERDKILHLLKELMHLERKSFALDINPDEKQDAQLIKELYESWKKYKKDITEITDKLRDSWKKETKTERNQYFG